MKTILSAAAFILFAVSTVFSQSLADAAKANRAKDAKVTAKRVWTDDDVQHDSSSPLPGPASAPKDYKKEANEALQYAKGLTAREMADHVVKDVQFPGRPEWETKLFGQEQKVIAAGQKVLDVINLNGSPDQVHSAGIEFDVEVRKRDDIKNDGIARAAEWVRKTARNGETKNGNLGSSRRTE